MSSPVTADTADLEDAARKILKVAQTIEAAFAAVPAAAQAPAAINSGYQTSAAMLVLLCTELVTTIRQLVQETQQQANRLTVTSATFTNNETNMTQNVNVAAGPFGTA